jgi:thymidylate synthase ThyX
MFTDLEKIVLRYFFTTDTGRVACATDNMPSSLWAYLVGSYSRSHQPIRQRLLTVLFKETDLSIEAFVEAIQDENSTYLDHALSKAESFLRKWAVEYGHNSLKDSSIDRFAIEECSILAAKAFEDSELGAYQEKSTRYLPFGVSSVDELALASECYDEQGNLLGKYRDVFLQVFTAYEAVLSYWTERHYQESSPSLFVNEAARKRTTRAQAFDKARYYLPVCVKTSFGATLSTRETSRLISRLLTHPLEEVRSLAGDLLVEVTKVNPGLFTHIQPDSSFDGFDPIDYSSAFWPEPIHASLKQVEELEHDIVLTSKCASVGATVQVTLPKSIRQRVAASFISFFAKRNIPSAFRPIAGITDSLSTTMIQLSTSAGSELDTTLQIAEQHYRKTRTDYHKDVPRYLDYVHVTLDVITDYGAYRDLQRHRAGKQDIVSFLSSKGVIEFPDFDKMPVDIQVLCRKAVESLHSLRVAEESKLFLSSVESICPSVYLTLLGHPVLWTYTCSLRQLVYLTELRSQPAGHISYRTIAREIASLVGKYIPWLFLYVSDSSTSTRAASENSTQEKLSKIST